MNARAGARAERRWGGALIAVGVALNPWVVGLATPDGAIGSAAIFLDILAVDVIAIVGGVLLLTSRDRRWAAGGWIYSGVWAVIFLGWVLHRSPHRDVGWYSTAYLVFVAVMVVPFSFAPAFGAVRRRLGTRGALLSIAPLGILALVAYAVGTAWYIADYVQRFDPFLQYPPGLELPNPIPDDDGLTVLTLGGSTTENRPMAPATRYPARLEQALADRPPDVDGATPVRVWNAGRAWYSTRHSLSTYTDYYHRLNPDVVVVMHAVNDLYRSCSPRDYAVGPYDPRWTHYYGASIRGARPRPLWARALEYLIPDATDPAEVWFSVVRHRPVPVPLEFFQSVESYELFLGRLVQVARGDGARVVVVTQPSAYPVPASRGGRDRALMGQRFCRSPENYWRRTFPDEASMEAAMDLFARTARKVARCRGATLADAASEMNGVAGLFIDDVHYTPEGAARLGAIVADAVRIAMESPPPEPESESVGCRPPVAR